jgi:hypothetical protein
MLNPFDNDAEYNMLSDTAKMGAQFLKFLIENMEVVLNKRDAAEKSLETLMKDAGLDITNMPDNLDDELFAKMVYLAEGSRMLGILGQIMRKLGDTYIEDVTRLLLAKEKKRNDEYPKDFFKKPSDTTIN